MSMPPHLPVRQTRLTAAERRQKILSAARELFAARGFHGTSTAQIAQASGCSEPMLYKHFSSKQELFAEVLNQVSTEMEAGIDKVLDQPGSVLENWTRFMPKLFSDPRYAEMWRFRALAISLQGDPAIQDAIQTSTERYMARVRRALARAVEEGSVTGAEADAWAWAWMGVTLAGVYRCAIDGADDLGAMLPTAEWLVGAIQKS